jgi:hypothetical protein
VEFYIRAPVHLHGIEQRYLYVTGEKNHSSKTEFSTLKCDYNIVEPTVVNGELKLNLSIAI